MCGVLVTFALLAAPAQAETLTPGQQIRARLDEFRVGEPGIFSSGSPADIDVLIHFYASRGYAPAWNEKSRLEVLVNKIHGVDAYGLTPDDYHVDTLDSALSAWRGWTVEMDILATDSLAHLARDLHIGKVDPRSLDPHWNLDKLIRGDVALELLFELTAANDLEDGMLGLTPEHFFYRGLLDSLIRYRGYVEQGGWAPIPAGPSLKPGIIDPRIAILRRRLVMTEGVDAATLGTGSTYDEGLAEAVNRFQSRHGLEADNIVGPETLKALNVSARDRVDQVRVNLERARWVLHDLGDEFVIINIAGLSAFLVRGREPVWSTRVVVGHPYRKTPVFKAEISYLVLNPTWTVPPTIMREDKMPAIVRDPGYLDSNNMEIRDVAGQIVDPGTISWEEAAKTVFPYQIVQKPGPDNALGQIKFMFPNEYFVYLHDTPNRELFEKTVRTFSSGCIRLENPFDLAERLLAGDGIWTRQALDEVVARGETRNVMLQQKMPIIVMYWTVQPSDTVGVRFFPDVYDRDSDVLLALDAAR